MRLDEQFLFPKLGKRFDQWVEKSAPGSAEIAKRHFKEFWPKAEIFLIPRILGDLKEIISSTINGEQYSIALPFQHCFFESSEFSSIYASVGYPMLGNSTKLNGCRKVRIEVEGILVSEIAPEHYQVTAFFKDPKIYPAMPPDTIPVEWLMWSGEVGDSVKYTNNADHFFAKTLMVSISKFCALIHESNLGFEKCYKNYNSGNHCSEVKNISRIIRIRPKNSTEYIAPIVAREIDWSHRWWVRGHWRKIKGEIALGKDRSGEYTVKNFTWVTEHLKGPEEMQVVNKIRIIQGEKTS